MRKNSLYLGKRKLYKDNKEVISKKNKLTNENSILNPQQILHLRICNEQIKNLAEKIYELCHQFREKLQKQPALDEVEELIIFYYDLAEAFYEFFSHSSATRLSLVSVKKCLEQVIQLHESRKLNQERKTLLMSGVLSEDFIGAYEFNEQIKKIYAKMNGYLTHNNLHSHQSPLPPRRKLNIASVYLQMGDTITALQILNELDSQQSQIGGAIISEVTLLKLKITPIQKLQKILELELALTDQPQSLVMTLVEQYLRELAECYDFLQIPQLSKRYLITAQKLAVKDEKYLSSPKNSDLKSLKASAFSPRTLGVTQLNDTIDEKEFLFNILPYLNYITSFCKTLKPIYRLKYYLLNKQDFNARLVDLRNQLCSDEKINSFVRNCYLLLIQSSTGEISGRYLMTLFPSGIISEGHVDNEAKYQNFRSLLCRLPMSAFSVSSQGELFIKNETEIEQYEQEFLIILDELISADYRTSVKSHSQLSVPVVNPLTYEKYYQQRLLQTGIIIYDVRFYDEAKKFRDRLIEKDKLSVPLAVVLRISPTNYIAAMVPPVDEKALQSRSRKIYIMNSNPDFVDLTLLSCFKDLISDFFYEIVEVPTPSHHPYGNDSLLHAYFNAVLSNWAIEKNYWNVLCRNFAYQQLTSVANIENIKQWWLSPRGEMKQLWQESQRFSGQRSLESLLDEFRDSATLAFTDYFHRLQADEINSQVEKLIHDTQKITQFIEIYHFLIAFSKNFHDDSCDSFQQTLSVLKKQEENQGQKIEVIAVQQILLDVLKKAALEAIVFQEQIIKTCEFLEDRFDHFMTLVCVNKTCCVSLNWRDDLFQLLEKPKFDTRSTYVGVLDLFVTIKTTSTCKILEDLIVKSQEFKPIINSCASAQAAGLEKILKKSLEIFFSVLNSLFKAQIATHKLFQQFKLLLLYNYDELDLTTIQQHAGQAICPHIGNFDFEFKDIEEVFVRLLERTSSIKLEKKPTVSLPEQKNILSEFAFLHDLRQPNSKNSYRQRAVYYFSFYLRHQMMLDFEHYVTDLVEFRANSLLAIEAFERSLHDRFLRWVKLGIEQGIESKLAEHCSQILTRNHHPNYIDQLKTYFSIITVINTEEVDFPHDVLNELKERLTDDAHSHAYYLTTKLRDLGKLIERFKQILKYIPEFGKIFWVLLHRRYDTKSSNDLFGTEGRIQIEILQQLVQQPAFTDIEKLLTKIDSDQKTLSIIRACSDFKDQKDDRAVTEISAFFRQTIASVTEKYSLSLIYFRKQALKSFLQFEREAFDYFSSYEGVSNNGLSSQLKVNLKQLSEQVKSESSYGDKLKIYQSTIQKLSSKIKAVEPLQKSLSSPLPMSTERYPCLHTHFCYLDDKINNLRLLLSQYIIDWDKQITKSTQKEEGMEYELIQAEVNSALLTDILSQMKRRYGAFHSNQEIKIIASGILHINKHLDDKEFASVNIVLVTHQQVNHLFSTVKVITDGDSAPNHSTLIASIGNGHDPSGKGLKGADGLDGLPGNPAGHIYVVASRLIDIKPSAKGGHGSKGQNGGNGASGKDGADGSDGRYDRYREGNRLVGNGWSYRGIAMGIDGQPGGMGGDPGSCGYGGEGGQSGDIDLIALESVTPDSKGKKGADGNNGKPEEVNPGKAGKHGRDGYDIAYISQWRMPIKARTYEEKRGWLYKNSRYHYPLSESRFCQDFEELHLELGENDPSLTGKYEVKQQTNALVKSNLKHTHQKQAIKIHRLNKKAIFQHVFRYFKSFIDSSRPQEYAHWMAGLKDFLEKYAMATGQTDPNIANLPDAESEIKLLNVLRNQFQMISTAEQQRLQATRIDSQSMSIGIDIMSNQLLREHQQFLQNHRQLLHDLQNQIDKINVDQLSNGLENRSLVLAQMREQINRRINSEKLRLSLMQAQHNREMLTDFSDSLHNKSPADDHLSLGIRPISIDKVHLQVFKKIEFKVVEFKSDNLSIAKLNEYNQLIQNMNSDSVADLLTIGEYLVKNFFKINLCDSSLKPQILAAMDCLLQNLMKSNLSAHLPKLFSWVEEINQQWQSKNKDQYSRELWSLLLPLLQAEILRQHNLMWVNFSLTVQAGFTTTEGEKRHIKLVHSKAMLEQANYEWISMNSDQFITANGVLPPFYDPPTREKETEDKNSIKYENLANAISQFKKLPTLERWKEVFCTYKNYLSSIIKDSERYYQLLANQLLLNYFRVFTQQLKKHLDNSNLEILCYQEYKIQTTEFITRIDKILLNGTYPHTDRSQLITPSSSQQILLFLSAPCREQSIPILRLLEPFIKKTSIEQKQEVSLWEKFLTLLISDLPNLKQIELETIKSICSGVLKWMKHENLIKIAQSPVLALLQTIEWLIQHFLSSLKIKSMIEQEGDDEKQREFEGVLNYIFQQADRLMNYNSFSKDLLRNPQLGLNFLILIVDYFNLIKENQGRLNKLFNVCWYKFLFIEIPLEKDELQSGCFYLFNQAQQGWNLQYLNIQNKAEIFKIKDSKIINELKNLDENDQWLNLREREPELVEQLVEYYFNHKYLNMGIRLKQAIKLFESHSASILKLINQFIQSQDSSAVFYEEHEILKNIRQSKEYFGEMNRIYNVKKNQAKSMLAFLNISRDASKLNSELCQNLMHFMIKCNVIREEDGFNFLEEQTSGLNKSFIQCCEIFSGLLVAQEHMHPQIYQQLFKLDNLTSYYQYFENNPQPSQIMHQNENVLLLNYLSISYIHDKKESKNSLKELFEHFQTGRKMFPKYEQAVFYLPIHAYSKLLTQESAGPVETRSIALRLIMLLYPKPNQSSKIDKIQADYAETIYLLLVLINSTDSLIKKFFLMITQFLTQENDKVLQENLPAIVLSIKVALNYYTDPQEWLFKINFLLILIPATSKKWPLGKFFEYLNREKNLIDYLFRLTEPASACLQNDSKQYHDYINFLKDLRNGIDKTEINDALINLQKNLFLEFLKSKLQELSLAKISFCFVKELPKAANINPYEFYLNQQGRFLFKKPEIAAAVTGLISATQMDLLKTVLIQSHQKIELPISTKQQLLKATPFYSEGVQDWVATVIETPQLLGNLADKFFECNDNMFNAEAQIREQLESALKSQQQSACQQLLKLCAAITNAEPIRLCLMEIPGYLDSKVTKTSMRTVIQYNEFIYFMTQRIQQCQYQILEEGSEKFVNILKIMAAFDDLFDAIEIIQSEPYHHWLKSLLIKIIGLRFGEANTDMFLPLDPQFLFALHNRLLKDYSEEMIDSHYLNGSSFYQENLAIKLQYIAELLQALLPQTDILKLLAQNPLQAWPNLLAEQVFNQNFNRAITECKLTDDQNAKERCLFYCNRIRVDCGDPTAFSVFFANLVKIIQVNRFTKLTEINQFLKVVYYHQLSFVEAIKVVSNQSSFKSWVDQYHKNKRHSKENKYDYKTSSQRSIADVISFIKANSSQATHSLSPELLDQIAQQADQASQAAKQCIQNKNGDVKQWVIEQIKLIRDDKDYQDNPEKYLRAHLETVLPVILCAWFASNHRQFPHNTQIVTFLAFILTRNQGLLAQVRTGEGKTLIVGLLAAFLALCGHAVDILSSNPDLAIEGVEKCQSFFNLLMLECSHICHKNSKTNQRAYQSSIVYGEISAFQGDLLQQEYQDNITYGDRYEKNKNIHREKYIIIDEVDSMGLDKAKDVLYLSHLLDSLKWLDSIFINIWAAVLRVNVTNPHQTAAEVADISHFILQKILNKEIIAPAELESFYRLKISRWVESAFQARFMEEKDQFVIDIEKTTSNVSVCHKNVIVIDKDTGVEQYATKWSEGVAQFLELKYRRKLSSESLKALFISNKTFFLGYRNHIYGLTGTLGSTDSRDFLSSVYQVKFIDIPPARPKIYQQDCGMVVTSYLEWLECFCEKAIQIAATRPVLIICENVEITDHGWAELIRLGVSPHQIKKYARADDKIETYFRNYPAKAGDIIIATNKGGRGTDIHVAHEVFPLGGMHVLLTYLPSNIRIEEQAFGRTSRNGAPGSGEFILYFNMVTEKEKPKIMTGDEAEVIIEKEKLKRDRLELTRLNELRQKSMLQMDVEEALFLRFIAFRHEFLHNFEKLDKSLLLTKTDSKESKYEKKINIDHPEQETSTKKQSPLMKALTKILEDRWAFWLDSQKQDIQRVTSKFAKNDLIDKLQKYLMTFSQSDNLSVKQQLINFAQNSSESIMLANVFQQTDYGLACELFKKAVKLGDFYGYGAMGAAYCLIKMNDPDKVKQARVFLKIAIERLELLRQSLMANGEISGMLAQYTSATILQVVSSEDNLYGEQISSKLEVIGIHLHYLKQALGEKIEPDDLVNPAGKSENSDQDRKPEAKELEDAQAIYRLLRNNKIIYAHRLRSKYAKNKSEFANLEALIKAELDPSIARSLVDFFTRETAVIDWDENDLKPWVCNQEELWQILNPNEQKQVLLIDPDKGQRVMENRFIAEWDNLTEEIKNKNTAEIDPSWFEIYEFRRQFKTFLSEKQVLIITQRAPLDNFDFSKPPSHQLFSKYASVEFKDTEGEGQGLMIFLQQLKKELQSKGILYLYRTDLPFATAEEESRKIIVWLKSKNIIKSGGLVIKNKCGDIADDIDQQLESALQDNIFFPQKDFIKAKLLNIPGDIRRYYDELDANFNEFMQLEGQQKVPDELGFFTGIGLDCFLIIGKQYSWWDWRAFSVAMLGLAQVIAGAYLTIMGMPNLGNALIAEGINDMVYATIAGLTGTFSWKDWAVQKAISLTISLATAGFSTLSNLGQTAAKVGSISRSALFSKVMLKAAGQFVLQCSSGLITEELMKVVQVEVVDRLVIAVEAHIMKPIEEGLQKKLTRLYTANPQDFARHYQQLYNNLDNVLRTKSSILPQQLDRLRMQLRSSLNKEFGKIIEGLSKSGSKYAEMLATALKAGKLFGELWNIMQLVVTAVNVSQSILDLLPESKFQQNEKSHSVNEREVKQAVSQLSKLIKNHINQELAQQLRQLLQKAIHGTLKSVGKVAVNKVKERINKQFQNQNPIVALKQLNKIEDSNHKGSEEHQHQIDHKDEMPNSRRVIATALAEDLKRPLGRTDIKMLADMKRRSITIINENTGKIETIHPHGARRMLSFFKTPVVIHFENENSIGHFSSGKNSGYQQPANTYDCLIISYEEARHRLPNAQNIKQARRDLQRYSVSHLDTFERCHQNIQFKGKDYMWGGSERQFSYHPAVADTNQYYHPFEKSIPTGEDDPSVKWGAEIFRQGLNQKKFKNHKGMFGIGVVELYEDSSQKPTSKYLVLGGSTMLVTPDQQGQLPIRPIIDNLYTHELNHQHLSGIIEPKADAFHHFQSGHGYNIFGQQLNPNLFNYPDKTVGSWETTNYNDANGQPLKKYCASTSVVQSVGVSEVGERIKNRSVLTKFSVYEEGHKLGKNYPAGHNAKSCDNCQKIALGAGLARKH